NTLIGRWLTTNQSKLPQRTSASVKKSPLAALGRAEETGEKKQENRGERKAYCIGLVCRAEKNGKNTNFTRTFEYVIYPLTDCFLLKKCYHRAHDARPSAEHPRSSFFR